jgi:hypothetical protein
LSEEEEHETRPAPLTGPAIYREVVVALVEVELETKRPIVVVGVRDPFTIFQSLN